VSTTTLPRRLLFACAAFGLVAAAGSSSAMPLRVSSGLDKFRPMQALSYELGSKRAIGYFLTVGGKCQLTLMIAESVDPDVAKPTSAARLNVAMLPGQSTALASEEGQAMTITCGTDAEVLEVQRAAARS
jgi:hypothetical protein